MALTLASEKEATLKYTKLRVDLVRMFLSTAVASNFG